MRSFCEMGTLVCCNNNVTSFTINCSSVYSDLGDVRFVSAIALSNFEKMSLLSSWSSMICSCTRCFIKVRYSSLIVVYFTHNEARVCKECAWIIRPNRIITMCSIWCRRFSTLGRTLSVSKSVVTYSANCESSTCSSSSSPSTVESTVLVSGRSLGFSSSIFSSGSALTFFSGIWSRTLSLAAARPALDSSATTAGSSFLASNRFLSVASSSSSSSPSNRPSFFIEWSSRLRRPVIDCKWTRVKEPSGRASMRTTWWSSFANTSVSMLYASISSTAFSL